MLKLYFITHTNDDGDNLDLFVIAHDRKEAVMLWREWEMVKDFYEGDAPSPTVFEVPCVIPANEPDARHLEWHGEVKLVL